MSNWTISVPGAAGGFSKEDHVEHRCVFVRPEGEEVAAFSGEGKQMSARCAYVVCLNCGLVLEDTPIFGQALVPALLDQGDIVAGTLTQGKARPGRSAPYILREPTADEMATAGQFLDERAVRLPSGKIVIEAPPAGSTTDEDLF